MPRPKTERRDQQVYKLDDGAIVTIDFVVGKKPKYFQPGDGIVIIGEHQCGPVASTDQVFVPQLSIARAPYAPVRNFEVSEDDPAYVAFKARLATSERTSLGAEAAPADFSPPVITNADLGKEFADKIRGETGIDIGSMPDPAALVAAAK